MRITKLKYTRLFNVGKDIVGKKDYITIEAECEVNEFELPKYAFEELKAFVEDRVEQERTIREIGK